jgi:hypothetical protein
MLKMLRDKKNNNINTKYNYDTFVVLSYTLLRETGWINPIQSIDNLHAYFRTKYNDSIDLCGEAGSLLRTLSVSDYFKFIEYDNNYRNNIC